MSIRNNVELASAVELIGRKIQEVQDYLGWESPTEGKIRFPRGYIRTAEEFRSWLWFIDDKYVRDNLAFALILSDVYRWLTNRTDLFGSAREMVIKAGIILMGSICETLAVEYTCGKIGRKHKFLERCKRMHTKKILTRNLCDELEWLWTARADIHIYEVFGREYERYKSRDYNRAIQTLRRFRDELNAHKLADVH